MKKYPVRGRVPHRATVLPDIGRREFLSRAAAAGMALGLPPLLASCGGNAEPSLMPPATEERVLFFNLSGHAHAGAEHQLNIAGKRFRLTPVAEAPDVLLQARQDNGFLRAMPNDGITHHVHASLPANAVVLGYVSSLEDPATGTWAMSSLYLSLPHAAHESVIARSKSPLQRSAKRRFYGMPAARSTQELRDEAMLVDSHDHACALISAHGELICLDPGSAAYIHARYIAPDQSTVQLAATLQARGVATVQRTPGQHNPAGWATLRPLLNTQAKPPVPYKKSDGKLNLYLPDWHPDVDVAVARAVTALHPQVRDDESLGMNVTPLGNARVLSAQAVRGRIWSRRDGIANVQRKPATSAEAAPAMTFTVATPETGLHVQQPGLEANGGALAITLDNVENWFLRWLGVWVKFSGPDGQPIPSSALPANTLSTYQGSHPRGADTASTLFVGILPQVNTVAGIPFEPGRFEPVITKPASAASMEVIYAGLGLSGTLDDPENLRRPGVLATVFINYFVVGLFLVVGAADLGDTTRLVVDLLAKGMTEQLIEIWNAVESHEPISVEALTLAFCKTVVETGTAAGLEQLIAFLFKKLGQAALIDSIPCAGTIARAVSVVLDAIELAETTLEVALSPPLYRFNLALTHTLSTSIKPGTGGYPTVAPGETLYYKVSYLFDNGTPHVLSPVDLSLAPTQPIAVTLSGIPVGGQVNIIVGFYLRRAATPVGQNDWCAAQGSTGLVDNNGDTAPDIVLNNIVVPIQSNTVYLHTSKTVLDAGGRHAWQADPDGSRKPAFLPPPGDQQPSLGGLRNITVTEQTARRPGYVGYAWKGYSGARLGCAANAPGQFDYVANLNTDNRAGGSAEVGYASIGCGLASGAVLGYSLLSSDTANVYLDPDQLYLRPVSLGAAPAFPPPGARLALGRLNLSSSGLLLHPSGQIVSINNENSKLEMLRLPGAPVDEATANRLHLARTYGGAGSRPGLMRSPVAAAVSADGVIVVLEGSDGNNRLQAFDTGGNPIPYFKKQARPYFLQLSEANNPTYLDLAVEYSGYLYVLSRDGSDVHRVDIYHPEQDYAAPICSTVGINAARLTVDLWRNVYTLNYEVMRLPDGSIPASLTEPSISLWVPLPPLS